MGFPKSVCVSANEAPESSEEFQDARALKKHLSEVICHGIPDSRPLQEGDIELPACFATSDALFLPASAAATGGGATGGGGEAGCGGSGDADADDENDDGDVDGDDGDDGDDDDDDDDDDDVDDGSGAGAGRDPVPVLVLVNLDVSVCHEGFHADLNETYFIGQCDEESHHLVRSTYDALKASVALIRPGRSLAIGLKGFTPSDVSGQNQVKSSVQRGIKTKIQELYPRLEPVFKEIWPKDANMVIAKCKDHISLVVIEKVPLFWSERDGPWLPTLRLLHKYPSMMPKMQVDKGAIKFVLRGASIMCPGLTSPGGEMEVPEFRVS
ncbi:mcts1 [Symbiodinium sp. KB8]|nr:mcts1 [Symbiodinium sp. KB8]